MILAISLLFLLLITSAFFYVAQPLFGSAQQQSSVSVDPARLEFHVRLLSTTLAPRDYAHPANLDRVAEYIRHEFAQAKGRVSDQPFQVDGRTYRNIIAAFGPETQERVIVGAHYDAAGPYPGADDNASGVAGLIELAHLLAVSQLPMQVELIAYTLEEPPFFMTEQMGSAVHARSLQEEGALVRAMLSLEMIGYFSDAEGSQHFPRRILSLLYPERGNFITVVGKFGQGLLARRIKKAMAGGSSLPVYSINAPRSIPGIDFSDHLNYWQAGYKAVMITDTSFYRNPNYHTAADTAETLDYRQMGQVVAGVYAAVKDLAQ
jgi:hypothetical protein